MLMSVALSAPTALAEPPGGEPDTPAITQTADPSGPQQPGDEQPPASAEQPSTTTPAPGSSDQTEPSTPGEVPSTSTPSSEVPSTSEIPSTSQAPSQAAPGKRLAPAAVTAGCQTYPPTTFQVCGLIRDKYNQMGGPTSFLLFPKSNELTNPGNTGKRTEFLGGNIYWSTATGAHPVAHDFLTKWGEKGYETGYLKYPTTDEIVLPGTINNRRQEYQGGSIYWAAGIGAHTIQGAIKDKWLALGGYNGALGYPTSDEKVTPDGVGRYNTFQHGSIYWSPTTGAHAVSGVILALWQAEGYESGNYGYPTGDQVGNAADPLAVSQTFQGGDISVKKVLTGQFQWENDAAETINCEYYGMANRIHVRYSKPTVKAWWVAGDNCPAGLKADVTVQLQSGTTTQNWTNRGPQGQAVDLYPGGQYANWASTEFDGCTGPGGVYNWRAEIDVDIIGYNDPPNKDYSIDSEIIHCRVA